MMHGQKNIKLSSRRYERGYFIMHTFSHNSRRYY